MQLKDASILRVDAYVDGNWIAGKKRFAVNNPANNELVAEVTDLGATEVTAAIDAAVLAQKQWAKRTAKDRAMIMRKWHDLIIANAEDLAVILTTEMGKPLAEAKGEVAYGASFIDWFAEEARRICGDVLETPQSDKRLLTFKQPVKKIFKPLIHYFAFRDKHNMRIKRIIIIYEFSKITSIIHI